MALIGFFNRNNTVRTLVNPAAHSDNSYYFIDDVSLYEFPTAGPAQTIACGNSVMLGAGYELPSGSQATYSWAPATGLDNPNILNPVASPNTTTTYTLTITAPGCNASVSSVTVTVTPATVDAGPDMTVCVNAPAFDLPAALNDAAGIQTTWNWAGNGVYSSSVTPTHAIYTFDPALAGAGAHQLTLTSTTSNGCVATDIMNITVVNPPVVSITPGSATTLLNTAPFTPFTGSASYGTGSWSGPGMSTTGVFNPQAAGLGTHTITFTATGLGCTNTAQATITVQMPDVYAGPDTDICLFVDGQFVTFDLNSLNPHPAGGTWAGPNLNGSVFSPTAAGAYTFEYIVEVIDYSSPTPTISEISDFVVITVHNPVVAITPVPVLYPSSGLYTLSATPAGGQWSGTGVTAAGVFDPSLVVPGTRNTVSYTYTDNFGCTATGTIEINVDCHILASAITTLGTSNLGITVINNPAGGTYTFPADVLLAGHLELKNGIFEINPGSRFFAAGGAIYPPNSTLLPNCPDITPEMRQRAFIIVGEGATLKINNTVLQANCNYMWGGIWLQGTGRIEITGGEIRDALFGVLSLPANCTGVNNSSYSITSSSQNEATIANCYNGLTVYNRASGAVASPVTGAVFQTTTAMHWETGPGLSLLEPIGITFYGGYYSNANITGNTFDGLYTGMTVRGEDLNIEGNNFRNFRHTGLDLGGTGTTLANVQQNTFIVDPQSGISNLTGDKFAILDNGRSHIHLNTFERASQQAYGSMQPAGILLYDGQHSVVERNTFKDLNKGVVFLRDNFSQYFVPPTTGGAPVSIFVAPHIKGNLFEQVRIGVEVAYKASASINFVQDPSLINTTVLPISCNSFKYTYNGIQGYGIKVEYLWRNSSDVQQHIVYIDEMDLDDGQPKGATMKNDFRVTGTTGYLNASHYASEFVDIGNHPSNNTVEYKTFNPQSTNTGTNVNKLTTEGQVHKNTLGLLYSTGINCENSPGNYTYGINTRQAKPVINSVNPVMPKPAVKLQNYPNPFARQTTIEYVLPEGIKEAEIWIYSVITGRVVKRQQVSVNEQSVLLNVAELAPGLYIYKLVSGGKVLATDKMMISNDVAYE